MQAAEMMRGTRAVCDLVFLISLSIAYVHSFPLQVLPSIPGYIPVYIRHGDQPLEEINPALAEAFHERSSLSKNIDLDKVSISSDINPEEDEANKYVVYPIQVRQVDNHFTAKDEKRKQMEEAVETKANPNKEIHREKHRRKIIGKPVVKVNPLTEQQKDALEKLRIDLTEEVNSLNNMHDSNLNLSELPSDKLHRESNEEISDPVVKVDQVITDESAQADVRLPKDYSQLSTNKDPSTSAVTNKELPKKERPLSNILSNVQKISVSPEVLIKLEKERTKNQSLEEKLK